MKNKIFYLLGAGVMAFSLTGCDLDINQDPYAVTDLDVTQLLTCTEYEVAATFSEGYYINAHLESYVQHTTSREVDNYSLVAGYSTLGNTWEQAYRYAIKNCDELIKQGDAVNDAVYAGIGRVLRAYTYLNMVDLWGDIPYSEANVAGIETPKADASKDIYNDLLVVINQAIANFKDTQAANPLLIGANDLFYGGDAAKWLKAANTLKLKLLVQCRKAKAEITGWQTELDALLAEDNFIGDGEDLQFPHSATKTPTDERKFGFVDEYEGGQKSVWINPWFYEVLNGKTYNFKQNPLAGVVDPRVPYYYVNQLTATSNASNQTDYRDGAFVSIFTGSNSGYTSNSQESSMTCIGIYPVGGKFDDGLGGTIGASSGNGIAPDKMLQAYSVPFMKAELVLTEGVTGDAKALLEAGIRASITHVNAVSKASNPAVPAITETAIAGLMLGVNNAYDNAATNDKKLEIVMTEKWIANFFNSVEAYSDIRRTGYPVLFKGNADRKIYTPYDQTIAASPLPEPLAYDCSVILDYPRIMWYPESETQLNKANINNTNRTVSDYTNVFWDVQ
ncbi:MAG: SusD/RagB family nutrient-binding outer membrane lipoprotein [Bacteroidaceae bacterium]|nr:SusD/RagB family nutrient-binding outer membrane lipoprotein [Bacteroidaceae bacterium]